MKIYIVRHGQDDDSVRGGWSDCGLTDLGFKQANALAKDLKLNRSKYNIGKIISSDLKRAVQTAEIAAASLNLTVEKSVVFREVNNGDLAGMDNQIADKLYPNLYWRKLEWNQQYPNGESPKNFYDRIHKAWSELIRQYQNYDKDILLVTHSGVINIIKTIMNEEQYSNKIKYSGILCCKINCVFDMSYLEF